MMLVRSKVWGVPVILQEPASNPLAVTENKATIISLTPQQIYEVMRDENSCRALNKFREVLIGGGQIPGNLEKELKSFPYSTVIRHSYGMSETYSHIALRTINGIRPEKRFKPFNDVSVKLSDDGRAMICTPFSPEGIKTNDLIELAEDGTFEVRGRLDFTINTGGVKLQAEFIENLIHETLNPESRFLISSIPDEKFGDLLVLVCENKKVFETADLSFLKAYNKYAVPKRIIEIDAIPYNSGGKPDRLKIREILSK
jgi:O-succinylbenzoic acid--CoA ligase